MKNLFLATAITAAAFFAIESTAQEEKTDPCADLYSLATEIMTARQNNVPMPGLMAIMSGQPALEAIVRDAYSHPAYSVKDNKQDAVNDFANDIANACYAQ